MYNHCQIVYHRQSLIKSLFQAEPALMFDSVHVFAKGLAALDQSHVLRPVNLSCDVEQPWDDGLSLYNYINAVSKHNYTQVHSNDTFRWLRLLVTKIIMHRNVLTLSSQSCITMLLMRGNLNLLTD